MDWLDEFPALSNGVLRALKKTIDLGFRQFTREYGEFWENLFNPLRDFLIGCEDLLTQSPWPLVLLALALIAWFATRSWRIVLGSVVTLVLIGVFGMWEDTMKTVSMVFVSTLVSLALGLPIGVLMSRYDPLQRVVAPVLDVMQTMPSFVYLIPVVMLLGIGKVPGLIAVVIFSIPPVIRFTNLGIRLVPADMLEAADAFGTSYWQKLLKVQFPLSLPTIMGGVNQTIMLALSMVVIASMIGVQGLGQPVLKAISNQYFTLGVFNGMAIVGIAIIFDRISQAYGKRLQRHLEVVHG
jgi:glycine betaine/proline transport system permease protein